jgi:uncharacterized protein YkwD
VRHWLRWLEACALAVGVLLASAGSASAHFDKDQAGDYSFAERQLCYSLQPAVAEDPKWVQWIAQAVANWNALASQTGWSFRPCAKGEAADISINFGVGASAGGDFHEDAYKSYHQGQSLKSKHYDLSLAQDVSGMTLNGVKLEGGHQGWDTAGAATLDPVLVVMHELTHAMRLTHSDAEGWNDGRAGSKFYFERPVAPGVHTGAVSADDIAETHKAAVDEKPVANFHYPLPPCFPDEAAREKARGELLKIMGQFQETIDTTGAALVGQRDPDQIKGLYARGKQAVSNLEAARDTLNALADVKICPAEEHKASPGPAKPADNSHGMRDTGQNRQCALAVVDEINQARTQPADYARKLGGDPAAAEAVAFLERQAPLPPLEADDRLAAAAARHAADQGQAGLTSHVGADGSTVRDRIQATGVFSTIVYEEIAIGQRTATGVVRQLIIDAGNPGRPHRADLFSALATFAGVGCGPHKTQHWISVIDLTASIMSR